VIRKFINKYFFPTEKLLTHSRMADYSDFEDCLRDPYRDDPKWEPWHANAVDVVGGPADESSSEESGLRIVHRCSDF
jgi:hypothetical protein